VAKRSLGVPWLTLHLGDLLLAKGPAAGDQVGA
jgi:hypothetical protein